MLYLIGGASRSGKTIIAKKISVQKGIPYLSLDWIMMGFTNGIPEFGVHDKLFPDEIAQRLWHFFKAMFESMIYVETNCIIEGEALLPELIIELIKEYPNDITICFLGYADVNIENKVKEIRGFSITKKDWLADKSDAYVEDHVKNMIAHSRKIKTSCKENKIKYIDTSKNFPVALEEAINYLS